MPCGAVVIRGAKSVIRPGEGLMPPGRAVMRLEGPMIWLAGALTWPRGAVIRFGRAVIPPGRALIWPRRALIWGPSAFPDGFYAVSGDPGPNPGSSCSKSDSSEPSPTKITTLGHEKAGWSGTRLPPPNRPPAHTGGKTSSPSEWNHALSAPTGSYLLQPAVRIECRVRWINFRSLRDGFPLLAVENVEDRALFGIM